MKILVVEDNDQIQRLLNRKLSKQGWEVHQAFNGREGVDLAQSLKPDLILMDMQMPIMDGYEATRTLRSQGYQGKIAALTASVMAKDTEEAKQDGCDYFIPKPLEKDFIQQIQSILDA